MDRAGPAGGARRARCPSTRRHHPHRARRRDPGGHRPHRRRARRPAPRAGAPADGERSPAPDMRSMRRGATCASTVSSRACSSPKATMPRVELAHSRGMGLVRRGRHVAGNLRVVECRLDGANLRAGRYERCVFERSQPVEVDFSGAKLTEVVFAECDLTRAEFHDVRCDRVRFEHCTVDGLRGVDGTCPESPRSSPTGMPSRLALDRRSPRCGIVDRRPRRRHLRRRSGLRGRELLVLVEAVGVEVAVSSTRPITSAGLCSASSLRTVGDLLDLVQSSGVDAPGRGVAARTSTRTPSVLCAVVLAPVDEHAVGALLLRHRHGDVLRDRGPRAAVRARARTPSWSRRRRRRAQRHRQVETLRPRRLHDAPQPAAGRGRRAGGGRRRRSR